MVKSAHIPSFEEYFDTVKESLRHLLTNLSDAELERYIRTEDAIEDIKTQYEEDKRRYVAGEISYPAFTESGAGTVAYNLFMLY